MASGFLLDTKALLRLHIEPRKFGRQTLSLLDSGRAVYYSTISMFEIAIKSERGGPNPDSIAIANLSAGLSELAFNARHAAAAREQRSLIGADPFDSMLLGQAAAEGLVLVTSDRELLDTKSNFVIDSAL